MNPPPPPPRPEDPDHRSLFEDFINRSLNLDGLDEETLEAAAERDPVETDDEGRIVFQLHFPGGGPVVKGALGTSSAGPEGAHLPPMPLTQDVRWQHAALRERPAKLRLYRPRIGWESHAGQLVVTLGPRAIRHLEIIPDVRPGWTAIRFHTGRHTYGELIEWRGNKAALHHLRLDNREITALVKDEDMPPTRPARLIGVGPRLLDITFFLAIVAAIVLAAALIAQRLPVGDGPTVQDLQAQVHTLQAQVESLQAELDQASQQAEP